MTSSPSARRWLRRLPFLGIAVLAIAGAVLLRDQLDLQVLARHQAALAAFRDAHYAATVAGFMAVYVAMVALSLPGATLATLTGGFLFGLFPGVFINAGAAGSGAILLFLVARMGFGAETVARIEAAGGRPASVLAGLRRNQWPALFLMRLAPVVPFFLANLLPAFAGVGLWPYAVTTYLGILPGAVVLTSVGAGLSGTLATGGPPDLSVLTDPRYLAALAGLCALAAVPLVLRCR